MALVALMLLVPFLAFLIVLSSIFAWRVVAGFVLALWIGVAGMWFQHWIASSQPGYNDGAGGALAVVFFQGLTLSLVLGSLVYATTLIWWLRKA